MNGREKIALKIFLIMVLAVGNLWAVFHFVCGILLIPRMPEERLALALEFLEEEEYIGMTLEECEEIFGDSGKDSPGQCVVYRVGRYDWFGADGYELYIYFDEDETVKAAVLKEEYGG